MSVVAVIHPSGLVGSELRESLDRRPDLWREMRLYSTSTEEVGTLTEVRGAAAMVTALESDSLDGVDVVFFCGAMANNRPILGRLPATAAGILLAPDAAAEDGHPVVAGVNLETASRDRILVSPHPATVVLAHLLHPLRPFAPRLAIATLLQPASTHDQAGVEELLEQTRAILTFASEQPREVFATQVAFNLMPAGWSPADLAAQLRLVLGSDLEISARIVQAGVFHCYGVNLYLRLAEDPGAEVLGQTLAEHPSIEVADDPELLGPIDVAGHEEVRVGPIEPDPAYPGGYWIWAVMDNLTCGGALNALQIYEAVGHQVTH